MLEYQKLVKTILENGDKKVDRTKTGTISIFGTQSRYPVSNATFPLVTLKRTWWLGVVHELLWFIRGETNIRYLVQNKVNIWNEWPFQKYQNSPAYQGETLAEFVQKVVDDADFAHQWGELGPVYGKQWRDFGGVDQLKKVIADIQKTPESRRLIVSAWNPPAIPHMLLPPCHAFFQFYVNNGEISLQLYQRSADVFLGVPFNIASYSLLLLIVAKLTHLKPKEFVHTLGDAHIYLNHVEQCKIMLEREPKKLPKVWISDRVKSIDDIRFEDITLENYEFHPPLKGKVAV